MIRQLGYRFCFMAALFVASVALATQGSDIGWLLFLVIGGGWALRHPGRSTVSHDYSKDW